MCKGNRMNEQSLFFIRMEYIFTQIGNNLNYVRSEND